MDGTLTRRELIGREEEIARFDRLLTGGGRVVAVAGEPGIGKSRLLAEFARRGDERRFLVLEGRASDVERDVPFAVFRDALDDYLASVHPRSLRPASADGRAELARVFPALAELGPAADTDGLALQEERYRSHHAVREMLDGLASTRPLLLVLDDLHWADDASVELLSHLLRHPPTQRLVVVLAHRAGQAPARLAEDLAGLERSDDLERTDLRPLSEEQARELIGDGVDPDRAAWIVARCGGNPFYIEQLARAPGSPPSGAPVAAAAEDAVAALDVPSAVASAISRELRELDPGAAALLRGGAVIGDGFDLDLAQRASELEAGEALAALDGLLEADLVRPTDVPRRFRFRHPIVWLAVYESAAPGWRLGAHERVASGLAERGEPATARARHVECSASRGDAEAIALLREAGAQSAPRAPAAAAHWYESALALVPEGDVETELGLLVPLARTLAACGRYEESLSSTESILALLPADAASIRARVVASAGQVRQMLGRHGEAHEDLLAALEALPAEDAPEAAALRLQLAGDSFFAADFGAIDEWIAEALNVARARGDRPVIAAAAGLRSAGLYLHGRVPEAKEALAEALDLIADLTDAELAEHLPSHSWTALGAVFMERFEDAIALLERAIGAAIANGKGHLPALMKTTESLALIWQGRLDDATELLDSAAEASILTRNPVFLAWARSLQSWSALIRGDISAGVELAESAVSFGEFGDEPMTATAASYLADVLVAAGSPERARDTLLAHAGGPGLALIERAFRARPYEILARAELDLGDLEAAEAWVVEAERANDGIGIDGRIADALRARATLELAKGDPTAAAEAAALSADAADRAGLPIEAARARVVLGRSLAAAGREEDAREALEGAHGELGELGASHYRDQAARELRSLGVRVARAQRSAGDPDDPLSPREREIAELVAAGQRNAEIAETLFLSVRTVEGHLRRIFAKLDITSRTQLAARLRDGG